MQLLRIDHLKISFTTRSIFTNLSFDVQQGARIGLVGANGSGKSTLLKAISGTLKPDAGTIIFGRGVTVGYLPQDIDLESRHTMLEAALQLPPRLAAVSAELDTIDALLGEPSVYNDDAQLTRTLNRQQRVLEQFAALGGDRHRSTVLGTLAHLGFTEDDHDLPAASLSGGQKKLVALARLVAEQPDLLLLDEPDNHLDVASKARLESFLNGYPGAVVLVSHDRYLLDGVVTEIAELENGLVTRYAGNYRYYKTERELRRLRQQQRYVAQQKEIAKIEAAITRFELWASMVVNERHIKQARSRRKMLDRMEERGEIIEKVTDRKLMDLKLNGGRGSKKAIEFKQVSMAFGDDILFLDLDFTLRHRERIGLVGPNGAGKSVLFKLITQDLQPLDGLIDVGPSTHIGYYAQEHQTLAEWLQRSPLELIRDLKPMSEDQAVAFLISFTFAYEQIRQPIHTMSGGERSRLQLATIMLQKPNLLLLDEPTNNLDIQSVEVLEDQLDHFEGAVLVISHDRYFLDNVVDQIVELEDGVLSYYPGGYTDYFEMKAKRTRQRTKR